MNDPDPRKRWWDDDYVWRPNADEAVPDAEDAELDPGPPLIQCWRCGQAVEETEDRCPHCRAKLESTRRRSRRRDDDEPSAGSGGLVPLIWFFVAMLVVSLVLGLVVHAAVLDAVQNGKPLTNERLLALTAIAEGIDTALVLIALAVVTRPKRLPRVSDGRRAAGWALAAPVLLGLLGLNLAYHQLLNDFLRLPAGDNLFGGEKLSVLIVLMICVQPAIVEELFFRYLALGTLRRHMGMHGAVLVSSVMFGMAHIGQPLSIPILTVVGMGLGYMRVMSGSMLVPMLMHFAHNLVVLLMVKP